jgi:hypothetical protein
MDGTFMLRAKAHLGSAAWIVSLANDNDDLYIVRVCASEHEATKCMHELNSFILPNQKNMLSKLVALQNILRSILEKVGTAPTTSEDLVLAVRKAIRYIELGKSPNKSL